MKLEWAKAQEDFDDTMDRTMEIIKGEEGIKNPEIQNYAGQMDLMVKKPRHFIRIDSAVSPQIKIKNGFHTPSKPSFIIGCAKIAVEKL